MPSITSLIKLLRADYPQFTYISGGSFKWDNSTQTVHYIDQSSEASHLIHELAHGLLEHSSYKRDIELLKMERDAWSYASTLGQKYGVTIDEEVIQDSLDTYRDWLHARSTCPNCSAVGIQTHTRQYHCLACDRDWIVNDARICALRRYMINQ